MTQRIVLDASAAVRLVLRDPESHVIKQILDDAALILAPSIFFSEVANGLWKYVQLTDELSIDEARERFSEAELLVDEVFPDRELIVEALHQAATYGHPVYDLLYVVLARRAGATVLTRDRRLARLLESLDLPCLGPNPDVPPNERSGSEQA